MKSSKKVNLLFGISLSTFIVFAQLGTEHYFPPIHSRQTRQVDDHYIYLSTPLQENVTVTVTDGSGIPITGSPFIISNSNPAVIQIGDDVDSKMFVRRDALSSIIEDKGLIITGNGEFFANFRAQTENQSSYVVSKAELALGTDFRIGAIPIGDERNSRSTFVSVMATEDNTTIEISEFHPDVTFQSASGEIFNDSFSETLNRGETFTISAYADVEINRTGLIGAKIEASKNISVISGNALGGFGMDSFQDYALDQIIPVERIGNQYIVVRGNGDPAIEKVQVIAVQDNTQIFVNGNNTPIANLDAGEPYLISADNFQGLDHQNMNITANQPFYLYQYVGGDINLATSEMLFIPPLNCLSQNNINEIPFVNLIGTRVYEADLFLVARKTNGIIPEILLNGTALTNTPEEVLGNNEWLTYRINNVTGNITIESSSAISLGVFGFNDSAGFGGFYSGFGIDVTETLNLVICSGIDVDLVEELSQENNISIPTGGTWTPALASGTDIFNSNADNASLIYTYEYTSDGCDFITFNLDLTLNQTPETTIIVQ